MPDSTTPPSTATDDDTSGTTPRDRPAPAESDTTAAPPTTVARPEGPAADMSETLTGGDGVFMGEPLTTDLDAAGYSEHEYVAAARRRRTRRASARATGAGRSPPMARRPTARRVLVRMPADPADFSGTVVLEWLNVSGGADANPEWAGIHEEVIRAGSRVGRRVGADDRRDGRPRPRADELARRGERRAGSPGDRPRAVRDARPSR